MATRRRAREIAVQILYELDLGSTRDEQSQTDFIRRRLGHHKALSEFCIGLVNGVGSQRDEIDTMLTESSSNWSLERMSPVDRNILRLGCFEISSGLTPDRVVINEAIEIAKRYSDSKSPAFINGILDRIGQQRKSESATDSPEPAEN